MLTDKLMYKGRLDQIIKKRYVKNVCLLVAGQHIRPPEEQGEQVQPVREEKRGTVCTLRGTACTVRGTPCTVRDTVCPDTGTACTVRGMFCKG